MEKTSGQDHPAPMRCVVLLPADEPTPQALLSALRRRGLFPRVVGHLPQVMAEVLTPWAPAPQGSPLGPGTDPGAGAASPVLTGCGAVIVVRPECWPRLPALVAALERYHPSLPRWQYTPPAPRSSMTPATPSPLARATPSPLGPDPSQTTATAQALAGRLQPLVLPVTPTMPAPPLPAPELHHPSDIPGAGAVPGAGADLGPPLLTPEELDMLLDTNESRRRRRTKHSRRTYEEDGV